jgi:hypothetical protein
VRWEEGTVQAPQDGGGESGSRVLARRFSGGVTDAVTVTPSAIRN